MLDNGNGLLFSPAEPWRKERKRKTHNLNLDYNRLYEDQTEAREAILREILGELQEGVAAQAKQAMDNLGAVLEEAGAGFDTVVKTVIYLANIADFGTVNEIYAGYFEKDPPARSCFEVAALPKGGLLEMESIAEIK